MLPNCFPEIICSGFVFAHCAAAFCGAGLGAPSIKASQPEIVRIEAKSKCIFELRFKPRNAHIGVVVLSGWLAAMVAAAVVAVVYTFARCLSVCLICLQQAAPKKVRSGKKKNGAMRFAMETVREVVGPVWMRDGHFVFEARDSTRMASLYVSVSEPVSAPGSDACHECLMRKS